MIRRVARRQNRRTSASCVGRGTPRYVAQPRRPSHHVSRTRKVRASRVVVQQDPVGSAPPAPRVGSGDTGREQELALLYLSQGRNPEADALLTAVRERRRSALGSEHPITIATLTPLGWIKLQQRDFESSRTLLQEELKAHEKANADTWQRSYCQSLLGAALMGQKKYEEAERLLLSGYQQLLQRAGTIPYGSRTNVERAGTWIVQLYEQWGKKENGRGLVGAKVSAMRPASPPPRPVRAKSSWV